MSTYCISDIHGHIDQLKEMLSKIRFKFNGEDKLYILGDVIDWGNKSIETAFYCKELSEKYENITILMGNHEYMMNTILKKYTTSGLQFLLDKGHFDVNRQRVTIEQYIQLTEEKQNEFKAWLSSLRYNEKIKIEETVFYLTHSNVYRERKDSSSYEYSNHYERMLWERVQINDNPIRNILGDSNMILVHGHTITSNYNSFNEDGKCSIYKDLSNQVIAIDCGAKAIGLKSIGRLGCIRLEDFKEYYVE